MIADPEFTPVTTPPVLTVATPVALLAHVPPEVASVRVVVDPTHTEGDVGEIAYKDVLMVIVAVVIHSPILYEIVAVPAAIPVTTPVVGLTVATPVALLDHVPPDQVAVSVVSTLAHIVTVDGLMVNAELNGIVAEGFPFTTICKEYDPTGIAAGTTNMVVSGNDPVITPVLFQ